MTGAVLIGILFGFLMQRGGFCGASLLSSAFLYREYRGILGIGAAIACSLVGFAVMGHLGWIIPNPSPMRLLSAVAGGTVFGVGMVLAGGCVTGTLFKAGEGRVTSMLALLGMGIGTNLAGYGLLAPLKKGLVKATREIRPPPGLDHLLGLPYPPLALGLGLAGLALVLVLVLRRRRKGGKRGSLNWKGVISGAWSEVVVGLLIGVTGWIAYLSSSTMGRNYPLGATYGVMTAFSRLVGGQKSGSVWQLCLVAGTIPGSALSAWMRGELRLRSADAMTLITAFFGGILVGMGAIWGHGCFTGNMISGLGLLSLHSALFALFMVLANGITTVVYLRGWSS